jgi:hypothetical protein
MCLCPYLLLGQVIRQVGDHDLGLGGNAIGRRASLTAGTLGSGLLLESFVVLLTVGLVGDVSQRLSLGSRGGSSGGGGGWCLSSSSRGVPLLLLLGSVLLYTSAEVESVAYWAFAYTSGAASASASSTTATASASTTARGASASALVARTLTVGSLCLLSSGLRLAGELDRNLALEDLLAGELSDGALGLGGSREIDESVANRAVGSRILRDRDGLAVDTQVS